MELLLLSNSTNFGERMFSHALDEIAAIFGDRRVLFVPYALADHDGYALRVGQALAPLGIDVVAIHRETDPAGAISEADALMVGGGNTFRLLRDLYRYSLVDVMRQAVIDGTPFFGSSAGTNIAGLSIRTTNDMPIVEVPRFDALGLVPFQVNPHYVDADASSTHMGETRAQRLEQFLEENDTCVLAMREGSWLRVSRDTARVDGPRGAVVFRRGSPLREVSGDVSELLGEPWAFDVP